MGAVSTLVETERNECRDAQSECGYIWNNSRCMRIYSISPELLVHAEEVNLGHGQRLVVYARVHRHRGDHAHKRAGLAAAHTYMPFFEVAGGSQRPLQEGDRVVESGSGNCCVVCVRA